MRLQSQINAGFDGMDEREMVEEVDCLEREDLRERAKVKAVCVVADVTEVAVSAAEKAAVEREMAALERRERPRRRGTQESALLIGQFEVAPLLGTLPRSANAPEVMAGRAGSSGPSLAAARIRQLEWAERKRAYHRWSAAKQVRHRCFITKGVERRRGWNALTWVEGAGPEI